MYPEVVAAVLAVSLVELYVNVHVYNYFNSAPLSYYMYVISDTYTYTYMYAQTAVTMHSTLSPEYLGWVE